MPDTVKYLVDDKGNKTSVLVPVKMCNALNDDYRKLQNKMRILTGVETALNEAAYARKTGKKLKTLKELLK